jgi:predicted AlkP superfamily pyrophosphatase or phosphodiesterase
MKHLTCLLFCFIPCLVGESSGAEAPSTARKGQAEHIVVVVWDGMRPDFITPQYTPTLHQLAIKGVFFKNHHPAYISTTEVNGTAIATGVYPNRSGIMANSDYRPNIGWLGPNATEGVEAIRRGDFLSDGNYILVPTVAEILHKAGYETVIAGTKPVALLHDRASVRPPGAAAKSVVLYKGHTIPREAVEALNHLNDDKEFPATTTHPNTAADAWTTKSLTQGLWKHGVPKYTLLWLSEPDASQHETGPGSDTSLSALESSDKNLEKVLKALEEKKVREKTDIFIVSDHGFSTIQRGPDVAEILKKSKFKAFKKFEDPEPGDVMVVGLGGSVSLYVFDHDEKVIHRLVEFFQASDFAGVIFSNIRVEGTFPLAQVRIGTSNSLPDVLVAMRWSAEKSEFGTPGLIASEGGKKGKGSHGSLSRFDMRNTLVAAGPDFKSGLIDELPTGNVDLAPTILHILGVSPPFIMDGRVLEEALVGENPTAAKPVTQTIEESRELPLFRWRQYLKFTEYRGTLYFDEGNGEPTPK